LKNIWSLSLIRIRIVLRNRTFLFFSLIMPMAFFFLYSSVFAKGQPRDVAYMLGPVISLTVMGTFWGLSATIVTWREQGILRRFRLAPLAASDILASSILANFAIILPTVVLELVLARVVYHVTSLGNLFSLLALVFAGIVSFGALGLIVASVTNTMQETQVINQILWFALIFFSGATFPLVWLPHAVQRVALFLPATYLITGLQKAIVEVRPISNLGIELCSLAAWAMLAFFISSQLFRWEPEAKLPRNAKLWALGTILPFLILGIWENRYGTLLATAARMEMGKPADSQQSAPQQ
jgi:ABC-type multidrug transport system permease subunit